VRGGKAQAFGGLIHTNADLDFRDTVSRLTFPAIKVENLDLHRLPDNWNIPPVVRKSIANGKLSGKAMLAVTLGGSTEVISTSVATLTAMAAASFTPVQCVSQSLLLAALPAAEPRIKSQ